MKTPICHESRDLGYERERRNRNQFMLSVFLSLMLGIGIFALASLIGDLGGFEVVAKSLLK